MPSQRAFALIGSRESRGDVTGQRDSLVILLRENDASGHHLDLYQRAEKDVFFVVWVPVCPEIFRPPSTVRWPWLVTPMSRANKQTSAGSYDKMQIVNYLGYRYSVARHSFACPRPHKSDCPKRQYHPASFAVDYTSQENPPFTP